MNDHGIATDDLASTVSDELHRIAPDVDLGAIDPFGSLQEDLDLDSMDFLSFVEGIHERTGIDIPERDFPNLVSLNACLAYLRDRLERSGTQDARAAPGSTH
jgi:acyl carrier protein